MLLRKSPNALLETPEHMLAWLESKEPGEIVTHDIIDNRACLGANFLIAQGFHETAFEDYIISGGLNGGWLREVINDIPFEDVTASDAIAAIRKVM